MDITELKKFSGEDLIYEFDRLFDIWDIMVNKNGKYPDFLRNAALIKAFDTEVSSEGIFGFLENSTGQFAADIIQAFRAVGDDTDADILRQICGLVSPEKLRAEFLAAEHEPNEVFCFNDDHELDIQTERKIDDLAEGFYIYTDEREIYEILSVYLDRKIKEL